MPSDPIAEGGFSAGNRLIWPPLDAALPIVMARTNDPTMVGSPEVHMTLATRRSSGSCDVLIVRTERRTNEIMKVLTLASICCCREHLSQASPE